MALTPEQMYLLNTMTYMSKEGVYSAKEGQTVEDFARTIYESGTLPDALKDTFWTAEEIKECCRQILNDDTLCEMTISHASRTDGGADRLVVTSPDNGGTRDAVVVFEGTTGGNEWRDNFQGGMETGEADGVSTKEQKACLDWYQSEEIQDILNDCDHISVTGHSKGGNKAKYITALDDSVDECVSFDGQGFSDEFMTEYSDEISRNQHKVTNYSNKDDYVNILLNDFGDQKYVEGSDVDGNFAKNHSIFTLNHSLPFEDHDVSQNPLMKEVDQIINSFIRNQSDQDKRVFLDILSEITGDFLGKEDIGWDDAFDYYDKLVNQGGWDVIKEFVEYIKLYATYELAEFVLTWLSDTFPWARKWIKDALEQVQSKPGMPNGDDIKIKDSPANPNPSAAPSSAPGGAAQGGRGGSDKIRVDTHVLEQVAQKLRALSSQMERVSGRVASSADDCEENRIKPVFNMNIRFSTEGLGASNRSGTPAQVLRGLESDMRKLARAAEDLSRRLARVSSLVEENEAKIIKHIPDVPVSPGNA